MSFSSAPEHAFDGSLGFYTIAALAASVISASQFLLTCGLKLAQQIAKYVLRCKTASAGT